MKPNHFSLTSIFALFFCVSSFAQQQAKDSPTPFEHHSYSTTYTDDCTYPDCQQRVEEIQAAYLALANERCEEIFVCVTCCNDGWKTFMTVVVRPNCKNGQQDVPFKI